VLLGCVIMVVYFTGLAEFLRVFLGLPLSWGGAASDAAVATLVVSIALWFRTSFTSGDTASTSASSEEHAIPASNPMAERLSEVPAIAVPPPLTITQPS
jgi:hypothetical protein